MMGDEPPHLLGRSVGRMPPQELVVTDVDGDVTQFKVDDELNLLRVTTHTQPDLNGRTSWFGLCGEDGPVEDRGLYDATGKYPIPASDTGRILAFGRAAGLFVFDFNSHSDPRATWRVNKRSGTLSRGVFSSHEAAHEVLESGIVSSVDGDVLVGLGSQSLLPVPPTSRVDLGLHVYDDADQVNKERDGSLLLSAVCCHPIYPRFRLASC